MSRRTRIKHTNTRFQLGRIHHNRYSQSQTHFPETYSTFGSPITMPTRFMPLIDKDAISYVSKQGQLLSHECPLLKLSSEQLAQAKSANITISGHITTELRQSMPSFCFMSAMACCCLFALVDSNGFRRKFFTRYSMQLRQYQELAQIITNLKNCQNLIINFQDNQATEQKMKVLTDAIYQAMAQPDVSSHVETQDGSQSNSKPIAQKKKHVTLRNYTYFMRQIPTNNILGKLANCPNINSIFVWQKIVVYSTNGRHEKTQSENFMFTQ